MGSEMCIRDSSCAVLRPPEVSTRRHPVRMTASSACRERESGMRFRNPQVSMGGCAGVPEYTLTDADESVVRQILAELG